jgi:hypothetical protein
LAGIFIDLAGTVRDFALLMKAESVHFAPHAADAGIS